MDMTEALEADWIQIRTILKAQIKRLDAGRHREPAAGEARERALRWVAECEKIILAYSVKAQ